MDIQTIAAYVLVAGAVLLALRAVVRTARGESKLPPCPGCSHKDVCGTTDPREEVRK